MQFEVTQFGGDYCTVFLPKFIYLIILLFGLDSDAFPDVINVFIGFAKSEGLFERVYLASCCWGLLVPHAHRRVQSLLHLTDLIFFHKTRLELFTANKIFFPFQ